MKRALLIFTGIYLLLAASLCIAQDEPKDLIPLWKLLEQRGLGIDDVSVTESCIESQDVYRVLTRDWEEGKRVCQVWRKAHPLRYEKVPNKGKLVYVVNKEYQIKVPTWTTKKDDYLVKEEGYEEIIPPVKEKRIPMRRFQYLDKSQDKPE